MRRTNFAVLADIFKSILAGSCLAAAAIFYLYPVLFEITKRGLFRMFNGAIRNEVDVFEDIGLKMKELYLAETTWREPVVFLGVLVAGSMVIFWIFDHLAKTNKKEK